MYKQLSNKQFATIEEFNDGGIRFKNSRIILIILIILLLIILIAKYKLYK